MRPADVTAPTSPARGRPHHRHDDVVLGPGALGGQRVGGTWSGQQTGRGQQHPARVVGHLERHRGGGRARRPTPAGRYAAGVPNCLATSASSSETTVRSSWSDSMISVSSAIVCAASPAPLELDAGELGEPAQRHVEDVVGLGLAQVEDLHQPLAAAAASSLERMTWMTSSMSRIATSRPSTRCSRSSRLVRRYRAGGARRRDGGRRRPRAAP